MSPRIACLVLLPGLGVSTAVAQIAIWRAPVSREHLAADPVRLQELLQAAGYQVAAIETNDLLEATRLTPQAVRLLIVPTHGLYPYEGLPVLEDYLKTGGAVLSLGGVPFSQPLIRAGGHWQPFTLPSKPSGRVRLLADFEQGLPPALAPTGGEGKRMSIERVSQAGGTCLRASTREVTQFEYVSLNLTPTRDAGLNTLHFRAWGDANTPLLGLEAREEDGSRWKLVVPLGTEPRDYTLFLPSFLSYATEGRGGQGDYLHPERVASLQFGFTRGMVGPGPHTVFLDDVELWECPVAPMGIAHLPRSVIDDTVRHYGALVKIPADRPRLPDLLAAMTPFENATLVSAGPLGTLPSGARLSGSYKGWTASALARPEPPAKGVFRPERLRVRPLLTAARGGSDLGPVVALMTVESGDLAGAEVAFFALDDTDVLNRPELRQTLLAAVAYLLRSPRVVSLSPTFGIEDEEVVMTLTARVVAAKMSGGAVSIELRVENLDGTVRSRRTWVQNLAPGAMATVSMTIPATAFDWAHYRLCASVASFEGLADSEVQTVDTTAVFRQACDLLVRIQKDDGTFSGLGYVDERGARGLLAGYEMTGEELYRAAALRWGDHELAEQRSDGGYRMGYGVSATGEDCYVADGGEIAIGMERLIKYVPPDRQAAYIDSVRRYFRYREGFRLPDGRISVGWVRQLEFTQLGEKRTVETPVRSDKAFGFVVGCTLASASALHRVTGEAEDRARALRDVAWFLDDGLKTQGVFAEAAQWAYHFLDDENMRARLVKRMRETLLPYVAEPSGWWYASGGRGGVTLGATNYYYRSIEASPEALTGVMVGLYYTVCDGANSGLPVIIDHGPYNTDQWHYLCYSMVSLAEVLRPGVTMQDIAGK